MPFFTRAAFYAIITLLKNGEYDRTYRNGIKEYFLMTMLFGAVMGILTSDAACFHGGFSVFWPAGCLLLSYFCYAKKYDKMRIAVAKERAIFCNGAVAVIRSGIRTSIRYGKGKR